MGAIVVMFERVSELYMTGLVWRSIPGNFRLESLRMIEEQFVERELYRLVRGFVRVCKFVGEEFVEVCMELELGQIENHLMMRVSRLQF